MPAYIQPADYAAYGIPDATSRQVEAASLLVDATLGRPEGLIWMPDVAGRPCYMAGLTPSQTFTIAGPISPGVMIPVTIPGESFGPQLAGSVAVLDRETLCGPVTIAAARGETLILESILYPHDAGSTLEFGLTLGEQVRTRGETLALRRYPVARILSIYGRQDVRSPFRYGTVNGWNSFPIGQTDYDADTGAVSLFGGDVSPCFSSARVQYVAGWSYATLPSAIKQAVAKLVSNEISLASEGFSPGIKLLKSGDATIERFAGSGGQATVIDSTIASLLAPYKIYRL